MKKRKQLLCSLLAMALLAGVLPAAHVAGGGVQIGGSALAEGENNIGGAQPRWTLRRARWCWKM